MLNHFCYHFTREEVFLEGHPDYDIHHQLHCDFTKKARKYEEQSRTDEKFNFKGIIHLLADWHKNHILKVDVKDFQYLLDKTVIEAQLPDGTWGNYSTQLSYDGQSVTGKIGASHTIALALQTLRIFLNMPEDCLAEKLIPRKNKYPNINHHLPEIIGYTLTY